MANNLSIRFLHTIGVVSLESIFKVGLPGKSMC